MILDVELIALLLNESGIVRGVSSQIPFDWQIMQLAQSRHSDPRLTKRHAHAYHWIQRLGGKYGDSIPIPQRLLRNARSAHNLSNRHEADIVCPQVTKAARLVTIRDSVRREISHAAPVALDGFQMVISELEVEQDYLRRAKRYLED